MKKDNSATPPKSKKTRGPKSGASYPYYNLDGSVEVSKAVHEKGGGTCSKDQLASYLKYSSIKNGAFLARLNAARMFGLIEMSGGNVSVTDRARAIFAPIMEDDDKKAKVEAFLSIEMFNIIFERFKGSQLPPEAGMKNLIENELKIVKDRVTPAYRVLMESAESAGFFDTHGNQSRLSDPTAGNVQPQKPKSQSPPEKDPQKEPLVRSRFGGDISGPPTGIHSAIIGLLRELPAPGPWEKSQKEGFMLAFKSTIDFIYPEKKEGES